jgi:hypothetical protein
VPQDIGVYPYVEAEAKEARDHLLLTVCTAQETGKSHGKVVVTIKDSIWYVTGKHNQKEFAVEINVDGDLPVIKVN